MSLEEMFATGYLVASIIILIAFLVAYGVCLIIAGVMASNRGQPVALWVFLAFLIGYVAIIILAFIKPDNNDTFFDNTEYLPYNCSKCGSYIKSKRCPCCGHINPDYKLIRPAPFTFSPEPRKNWVSQCGVINAFDAEYCQSCTRRKPESTDAK